jgi:hypothetical protein
MRKYLKQVLLYGLSIVLTFLSPIVSVANDNAQGLWGVGVQIGFAELGSNQGMDPALVASALSYARILALQSGCIPTNEIDGLLAAVRNTRDSRSVYPSITAYRQSLAYYIVNNCSCGGTAAAPDNKAPNIAGQWKEVGGGCTGTMWNVIQVGGQVTSISAVGQCTGGTFQVWDGASFQWISGNVLAFKAIYKQCPWGWRENNIRVTFLSDNKANIEWRSDDGKSGTVGLER